MSLDKKVDIFIYMFDYLNYYEKSILMFLCYMFFYHKDNNLYYDKIAGFLDIPINKLFKAVKKFERDGILIIDRKSSTYQIKSNEVANV
jgi:hypothetical protein